jgi:hypothetical protein
VKGSNKAAESSKLIDELIENEELCLLDTNKRRIEMHATIM